MNSLGKWKTALQMAAMSGMLLLRRPENLLGHDHAGLEHAQRASHACLLLLWAGAFLSVRLCPCKWSPPDELNHACLLLFFRQVHVLTSHIRLSG